MSSNEEVQTRTASAPFSNLTGEVNEIKKVEIEKPRREKAESEEKSK